MKIGDSYAGGIISNIVDLGHKIIVEIKMLGYTKTVSVKK